MGLVKYWDLIHSLSVFGRFTCNALMSNSAGHRLQLGNHPKYCDCIKPLVLTSKLVACQLTVLWLNLSACNTVNKELMFQVHTFASGYYYYSAPLLLNRICAHFLLAGKVNFIGDKYTV